MGVPTRPARRRILTDPPALSESLKAMAARQDGDYEPPVLAEPDHPDAPIPTTE